jgi:hypothetical protein
VRAWELNEKGNDTYGGGFLRGGISGGVYHGRADELERAAESCDDGNPPHAL